MFNKKRKKSFLTIGSRPQDWKIGLMVLIIVSLFLLNIPFFSAGVRNFFYSLSEPLQNWFWEKGGVVSDFLEMVLRMKKIEQENEKLKSENQELISKNIELEQLRKENEVLRTALNLRPEEEFDLTLSQVIGKETSNDYLIINKGSLDGLAFGFPVITQEKSLVGRISEVYESISKVKLSTSKDISFDAEILGKEIYGLAKGEGNLNLLFDLVPREKEINEGDKVITAVLGGNFPRGLLVGEIKEVKKSDVALFQQAEIQPAFSIGEIDYLFIITNFNL